METKNQAIGELIKELVSHLQALQYSECTVNKYRRMWLRVKRFMDSREIKFYKKEVGDQYLKSIFGPFEYSQLDNPSRYLVNRIAALDEFQNTRTIAINPKSKPSKQFIGEIGSTMSDYILDRKLTYGLSDSTLQNYINSLHTFLNFLDSSSINSISQINTPSILSFINMMDPIKVAKKHDDLHKLKGYFEYLYTSGLSAFDFSTIVPRDNYKNQSQLPSTYSKEEIVTLLNVIDRSSPKGKRDYAIILLATKLGMRAGDIRGLKFEHIVWERNIIEFNQHKEGNPISLPLLGEVGNSIIDYLQHGRPESKENFIFISLSFPYKNIHRSCIGNLVSFYMRRAGINYHNRKHGSHALRHSLAMTLLSNQTPLPIISESLGHNTSESTMYYLRIDIESLRQCALAIPSVSTSFYNQKGGLNHD